MPGERTRRLPEWWHAPLLRIVSDDISATSFVTRCSALARSADARRAAVQFVPLLAAGTPDRDTRLDTTREREVIASSAQDNAYLINNSVPLTIYTTVGFFLGLAAIFGVLYQPRRAFRSCGRHKWRWILIEIVGTLLNAGVFVWFIWRFFIRKSVIRAGGRTRERVRYSAGGDRYGAPIPANQSRSDWAAPKQKERCSSCRDGMIPCSPCGGRGTVKDSYTSEYSTCPSCGGRGGFTCINCHGTGWRD